MPEAPAAQAAIDVVFAKDLEAAQGHVGVPALVIVPQFGSWNDHNRKLYAKLFVQYEGGVDTMQIGLMFRGHIVTATVFTDLFEERGPVVPAADVGMDFVTLQRDATDYALLVHRLGFDAAIFGLRAIHDAVLARLEEMDQATLELVDTRDFHIGMMRTTGLHAAFRRGGQYLRRMPAPEIEDAARSLSISVALPSSEELLTLECDFEADPLFKDRCCVIIGENGVGKTQVLRTIIEAQLASVDDRGYPVEEILAAPCRRLIVYSSTPSDCYPRAVAPWSGVDYEYHPLVAQVGSLASAFLDALIDCLRNDGTSFGHGLRIGRAGLLEDLLTSIGFYENLFLPLKPEYEREYGGVVTIEGTPYLRIDRALGDLQDAILPHAVDRSKEAAVLADRVRIRQLSSGELVMINFIVQVVASIENGSLLLFDEPETHLHPRLISQFMSILQDLLEKTHSAAIIATHSPHVVREVPRQRVNILRVTGQEGRFRIVEAEQPQMQTFGSNIDDISRFVFGDGMISHRYQRILRDWALEHGRELGIDRIIDQYGGVLNSETLSFVARTIRDAEA